jgi:hypothetical protein
MSSLSDNALLKGADDIFDAIAKIVASSLATAKPGQ